MTGNQILLVEDNSDDEILMVDALRRSGLAADVVVARDGAEALDFLIPKEDWADELKVPKLILLDLKLPKVSGLDVLLRLRASARTRYVPVVMLTSSSEREDIIKSYANGANAYMRKPIDHHQFLEAVRCLETFWVLFNETV